MAMTYNLNPKPLIPAGDTPQERYQSAMSLGLVEPPFFTSTMMPASPMARTNYLEPTMAAIQQKVPQREAFAGVPFPRPTMLPRQDQGVPLSQRLASATSGAPTGLDQLRAAQLRMPAKGSPEAAGLSAAGTQLLAAGGWQDRPVTLGQTLASGMQAYTTAKKEAEQLQYDKQRQALADQLALASFQLDVQTAMKPKDPTKPQVETFYDQLTGLPYKAQWNPNTQSWDKIGGVKIGDSEQIIIDPVTGQVTITKGTGKPQGGVDDTQKRNLTNTIDTMRTTLSTINAFAESYDPEMSQFGNRVNLLWSKVSEGFGAELSPQEQQDLEAFITSASLSGDAFVRAIKEMSGVAVKEDEIARLEASKINVGTIDNPLSGDTPTEIKAKLKTQRALLFSGILRSQALLSEEFTIEDLDTDTYPLSVFVTDVNGENKRVFYIYDEYLEEKEKNRDLTEKQFMEIWAETVKTARANEAAKKG